MAQDPNAQPPSDQQAPGQPPGDDAQGPLTQMIIQTDQALSSISQVLAKASPDAARAMAQLNDQYRQIIQAVMSQQQGGGQQAPQMASPETQGKAAFQAY